MRLVLIPAPVQICGLWVSMSTFTSDLLDRDPRFTKSLAGIRAAVRIETALSCEDSSVILDEADWILLKTVVEEPADGYMTLRQQDASGNTLRIISIARALLPFIDAVIDAKKALKVVSRDAEDQTG